jgi:hypothetical protein
MSRERRDRSARNRSCHEQSFADPREKALDQLANLYAKDAISLEEFERLVDEMQKAADPQSILNSVIVAGSGCESAQAENDNTPFNRPDKPPSPNQSISSSKASFKPLSPNSAFDPFPGAGDFFLCIMGERKVNGRMLLGKSASSITLMGSTVIDLRDIEVPAYGMHIEVIAIMGETSIIVSPEMHVHLSVVPIMGEAKSRAGVPFGNSNQGILEIGGVALMGSVSVRAVP